MVPWKKIKMAAPEERGDPRLAILVSPLRCYEPSTRLLIVTANCTEMTWDLVKTTDARGLQLEILFRYFSQKTFSVAKTRGSTQRYLPF